ncbi:MAG: YkgJ family cysteine cluster protein [Candidatus Krumholzibacteriia bacterium]
MSEASRPRDISAPGAAGDDRDDASPIDRLKEKILSDYERMSLDDGFAFGCHPGVPCFNECCGDVNIFLTPYDVLRMKNALGMGSAEFLERYTQIPIERNQAFPVVMLKLDDAAEGKPCQLVGDRGCSIYNDRPWPCRMYPLGLASPKDKDAKDFYFLMKEDVCRGFEESGRWTVREWLEDQGIGPYDEFGRLFKEITLHDYFGTGRKLTPERLELFYMACYDLDSFRRFVFRSTFLKRFDLEPDLIERIRDDDEELLRFAFRWLKLALFGEPTVKIRPDAMPPAAMAPKDA